MQNNRLSSRSTATTVGVAAAAIAAVVLAYAVFRKSSKSTSGTSEKPRERRHENDEGRPVAGARARAPARHDPPELNSFTQPREASRQGPTAAPAASSQQSAAATSRSGAGKAHQPVTSSVATTGTASQAQAETEDSRLERELHLAMLAALEEEQLRLIRLRRLHGADFSADDAEALRRVEEDLAALQRQPSTSSSM